MGPFLHPLAGSNAQSGQLELCDKLLKVVLPMLIMPANG